MNKTKEFKWTKLSRNYYLTLKGFGISYNPNIEINLEGRGETALVVPDKKRTFGEAYLILNGDHRKEYEDILRSGGGKKGCIKYFEENTDKGFWSN